MPVKKQSKPDKRFSSAAVNDIFLIAVVCLAAFFIFRFIGISPKIVLVFLGLAVFFLSFFKTDFALGVLIFSMLLSPEIAVGRAGGREVVIRLDDIFLLIIFLGWLAKMAVNKELGLLKSTPLNKPIAAYIVICVISSLLGALRGEVKLQGSIFYILKYTEYFILFFMVVNNLKSIRQVKILVFSFFTVALLISIYAVVQHFQGVARVTAPFEGKAGEANTLGGYLVLMISIAAGLILNYPSRKLRLFLGSFLAFALPALIFTLSRGSWLAFIPAVTALIILTPRGKMILLVIGALLIVFSSVILPRFFYQRVSYTFSQGREYELFGRRVRLEDSAATRIELFKFALQKWSKRPIIGGGVGSSLAVIDNQYARILIELGTAGFIAFILIITTVFRNVSRCLHEFKEDRFAGGFAAGFLAGLIGLLVHAVGAETFILIRVMEPFWFMAAMVMMLPYIQDIYESKQETLKIL